MRGSFCPSCGEQVDGSNGASCRACGKLNHGACLDVGRCQPCVRAGVAATPAAAPSGRLPADPPKPWTCPRCKSQVGEIPTPAPCPECGREVFLAKGPAENPALRVQPGIGPLPPVQRLKFPGIFTIRSVTIDRDGVRTADMDPIVGMAESRKTGIPYGDVHSIAGWRRVGWRPIFGILVFGFPTLLFLAAAEPVTFILALVFFVPTALCFYAVIRKERWMRVSGTHREIDFRYDRPWRKTDKFRKTLVARCGMADPEA